MGKLQNGTSGLGVENVNGRRRVPNPPTRISAFKPREDEEVDDELDDEAAVGDDMAEDDDDEKKDEGDEDEEI